MAYKKAWVESAPNISRAKFNYKSKFATGYEHVYCYKLPLVMGLSF